MTPSSVSEVEITPVSGNIGSVVTVIFNTKCPYISGQSGKNLTLINTLNIIDGAFSALQRGGKKDSLTLLGLQSRLRNNWGQITWNMSALPPKRD